MLSDKGSLSLAFPAAYTFGEILEILQVSSLVDFNFSWHENQRLDSCDVFALNDLKITLWFRFSEFAFIDSCDLIGVSYWNFQIFGFSFLLCIFEVFSSSMSSKQGQFYL